MPLTTTTCRRLCADAARVITAASMLSVGVAANDERDLFDRLDIDRDGFISRAEFQAGVAQDLDRFSSVDRDGDGRISRDEFRQQLRDRLRERVRRIHRND